ncbi:MAG: CinA family protein [Caulobacteraceae bacterium]
MAEALDAALPPDLDDLAHQVVQEACDRRLKLVTAESCTGGLLASLLTDIPGCSHAFERAFVTYSAEAKSEMLGVPAPLLASEGAVSRAVAIAMAEGALARSKGDMAVSITGFTEANPETGQDGGLVHFAAARHGTPTLWRRIRFGDIGRAEVRLGCLETGLQLFQALMRP